MPCASSDCRPCLRRHRNAVAPAVSRVADGEVKVELLGRTGEHSTAAVVLVWHYRSATKFPQADLAAQDRSPSPAQS